MRVVAILLLVALCARAEKWDALKAVIEEERFEEALKLADEARSTNRDDGLLAWLRAQAVVGVARDLQRAKGYGAALEFFEGRLDHEVSAYWYARTCGWAGEEERGLAALRKSPVPAPLRLEAELNLLALLRRYEEIVARASEVGGEGAADWIDWAREKAALRDRIAGRARVSITLSLVVIGVAAAGVAITLVRRPATG
jgi:hypothetical protein